MQIFHELGHVIAGLLSGAEIEKVYLHPLTLSRTAFSTNPKPLFVVWMGPIIGVALPFLLYLVAKFAKVSKLYMFRLFSGFCCIANGIYISFGFGYPALDSGLMLSLGTPLLFILGFGVLTIPLGFYLWNGLGNHFGLGKNRGLVAQEDIRLSFCILLTIVIAEIVYSLV